MIYDELIKWLRETPSIPVDAKMHNEAADAIERLDVIAQTYVETVHEIEDKRKWIPVTERLPEYGEKCLVVRKLHSHNDIRIDVSYCYVQREGFWSDNGRDWHVTHWMPLPQPPKDGEA